MLLGALCIYAGTCAALFFFQRSLIYFPQPRADTAGATIRLNNDGADLVVSVRHHAGPHAVLYFGGNAEDVSRSLPDLAAAFPVQAIYLLHYRSYGGSSGRPSEKAIYADALALFDHVRTQHTEIAAVGRSLGSGVATYLASQRPVQKLVLVTPYDSIEALAAQQFRLFPVRWLLLDKFLSWQYAAQITVPTTVVAAEHDEVIPRASTMRLLSHFRQGIAALRVLPGTGHNDISFHSGYAAVLRGTP